MSHNPPPPETCHRTGLVMTCFEDGKKQFRTALLAQELPTAAQEAVATPATSNDSASAARIHD